MVSESERNQAVADLLTSEVERTSRRAGGDSGRHRPPAHVRSRSVIVTGVVAAAVIAVSVLAIAVHRTPSPAPAATPRASTAPTPIPGAVLATFVSRDGRSQQKVVAANGSAVQIVLTCTGAGTISVVVPGGPSYTGPCDGATTTASPASVRGRVTASVDATGGATWTISIEAISTHGSGVILPG